MLVQIYPVKTPPPEARSQRQPSDSRQIGQRDDVTVDTRIQVSPPPPPRGPRMHPPPRIQTRPTSFPMIDWNNFQDMLTERLPGNAPSRRPSPLPTERRRTPGYFFRRFLQIPAPDEPDNSDNIHTRFIQYLRYNHLQHFLRNLSSNRDRFIRREMELGQHIEPGQRWSARDIHEVLHTIDSTFSEWSSYFRPIVAAYRDTTEGRRRTQEWAGVLVAWLLRAPG